MVPFDDPVMMATYHHLQQQRKQHQAERPMGLSPPLADVDVEDEDDHLHDATGHSGEEGDQYDNITQNHPSHAFNNYPQQHPHHTDNGHYARHPPHGHPDDSDTPPGSSFHEGLQALPPSQSSQPPNHHHPQQPPIPTMQLLQHDLLRQENQRKGGFGNAHKAAQRASKEGHHRGQAGRSEEGSHYQPMQDQAGNQTNVLYAPRAPDKSVTSPLVGSGQRAPINNDIRHQARQNPPAQPAQHGQQAQSPCVNAQQQVQPPPPVTPTKGEKRKATASAEEDEVEAEEEDDETVQEEDDADMEEDMFDPTGEVPVLDVKNQFVEPWKKLEAEAVEHIEEFSKAIVSHACQIAHEVSATFYAEFQKTKAQLESGAAAVKNEEVKHYASVKRYNEYVEILRSAKERIAAVSD